MTFAHWLIRLEGDCVEFHSLDRKERMKQLNFEVIDQKEREFRTFAKLPFFLLDNLELEWFFADS
jgi:hypothetical protein